MISSKNKAVRTLAPISSVLAREFLRRLANLREDSAASLRFKARFGRLFLAEVPWQLVRHWAVNIDAEGYDLGDETCPKWQEDDLLRQYWLLPLRDAVRGIWKAPGVMTKQWAVFVVLANYFTFGDRGLFVGPILGPLESSSFATISPGPCGKILLHLIKNAELTRYCGNPECPAPYFFAARRSQKYCSTDCSEPAQRASARKWWRKHGPGWRRARVARRHRKGRGAAKGLRKGRA